MIYSISVMSRTVLVTGGSIGIGRAICIEFAKLGYKVIFSYYRDKDEATEVEKECRRLGAPDVFYHYLNLMDDDSIKKFTAEVVGRFGFVDVFVNNAATIAWKPLSEQSFDEIESQVRTNLEGLIKITKIFIPYIKDMIINISSGAGKTGFADLTTYCATKFGVRGFTQALAKELNNIKVVVVNPDMTQTRMTNFVGRPPSEVASIVVKVAENKIRVNSGEDVDVWRYV